MIESIENSILLLLKELGARAYLGEFEDKSAIEALFADSDDAACKELGIKW